MHVILQEMLPIYAQAIDNYIEYNKQASTVLKKIVKKEVRLRKSKYASAIHLSSTLKVESDISLVESMFNTEKLKITKVRGKHAPGVYDGLLDSIIKHFQDCKTAEDRLGCISSMYVNDILHMFLRYVFTYSYLVKLDHYLSSVCEELIINPSAKHDTEIICPIILEINEKIQQETINDSYTLLAIIKKLKDIKNEDFTNKMQNIKNHLEQAIQKDPYENPYRWISDSSSDIDSQVDINDLSMCSSAPILSMFAKPKQEKNLLLTDKPLQHERFPSFSIPDFKL